MDYGILVPPLADSWKVVKRAEEIGFTRAWFFDTPMLNSELFISMAAAALKTSTIRLATGVLIPGGRIPPVAASSLASLNALAPGRIDWGIGTGFTGRRTMGLGPTKLAEVAEYIRVVQRLLTGKLVEWESEQGRRKVCFLDPDIGAINLHDPIPLHMSAFGPRGRKLTAELGAGWISGAADAEHGKRALAEMMVCWKEAGRAPSALYATATAAGCVLRDGERYDSPRVKTEAGPNAMIALHSLAERGEFGDISRPVPSGLSQLVDRYREIYFGYQPADARYLSNHKGHLMYLRPEELDICTGELIRSATWTGPKAQLRERLREIANAGYSHFALSIGIRNPGRLEDWAEVFEGV